MTDTQADSITTFNMDWAKINQYWTPHNLERSRQSSVEKQQKDFIEQYREEQWVIFQVNRTSEHTQRQMFHGVDVKTVFNKTRAAFIIGHEIHEDDEFWYTEPGKSMRHMKRAPCTTFYTQTRDKRGSFNRVEICAFPKNAQVFTIPRGLIVFFPREKFVFTALLPPQPDLFIYKKTQHWNTASKADLRYLRNFYKDKIPYFEVPDGCSAYFFSRKHARIDWKILYYSTLDPEQ